MPKHNHKALERRIDRLERKLKDQKKALKALEKQLAAANPEPVAKSDPEPEATPKPDTKAAPKRAATAKKSIADDLTAIVGIGPATQATLQAAGISTYEQLATMTSDTKATIVDALGSFSDRMNRDRWIEQAKDLLRS